MAYGYEQSPGQQPYRQSPLEALQEDGVELAQPKFETNEAALFSMLTGLGSAGLTLRSQDFLHAMGARPTPGERPPLSPIEGIVSDPRGTLGEPVNSEFNGFTTSNSQDSAFSSGVVSHDVIMASGGTVDPRDFEMDKNGKHTKAGRAAYVRALQESAAGHDTTSGRQAVDNAKNRPGPTRGAETRAERAVREGDARAQGNVNGVHDTPRDPSRVRLDRWGNRKD